MARRRRSVCRLCAGQHAHEHQCLIPSFRRRQPVMPCRANESTIFCCLPASAGLVTGSYHLQEDPGAIDEDRNGQLPLDRCPVTKADAERLKAAKVPCFSGLGKFADNERQGATAVITFIRNSFRNGRLPTVSVLCSQWHKIGEPSTFAACSHAARRLYHFAGRVTVTCVFSVCSWRQAGLQMWRTPSTVCWTRHAT